ncbi:SDR family NAD(P)-dependent oxidoreductase [Paeniglutamicibacter sp. R2-26]|uniref:SDR family NAD(P)-dependent oxidoreductase n=1 Tax=Paeniglutamicibacter sp. R2-26 TaxID=3144417 RepID=UPI003EE5F7F2
MARQRIVVVTGGAGGIGRSIGMGFAAQGDRVVLVDRDAEAVALAAADIGAGFRVLDLTDARAVEAVFEEIAEAEGGIDVLVNNAGLLSVHGTLTELRPEDYEAILRVNVLGTFMATQAVARGMIARETAGAIVNISSIGSRQPTFGMGGYESSKAAVDSLTRWASLELSGHSIRVNAVAPGPVLTPMLAQGMPEGSEARAAWESRIPLRALAETSDVAEAVLFLASERARHITGVSLPVDGGQLLT